MIQYLYCGPLLNKYRIKERKDNKTIKIKNKIYQVPEFDIE